MINIPWPKRRKPVITAMLIGINVLIFFLMEFQGGASKASVMIRWGASYYPLVVGRGEYYRLLFACFLHFNMTHLMSNMIALGVIGYRLEKIFGHIHFFILYLLCGMGSSAISLVANHRQGVDYLSAGASGAIFGIVGALAMVLLLSHGSIDGVGAKQMGIAVIFLLLSGAQDSSIDQWSHGGGLVLGAILSFLIFSLRLYLAKWKKPRYD